MKATTKDLRYRTRELLAAAARGEEVAITYRGQLRARLMPCREESGFRTGRNPAFGLWSDRNESVDAQVDALRAVRIFKR